MRRILLALDAITPLPPPALESAAGLAARLSAELCGLFVEDVDLLRSAQLPFAATIDLLTASPLASDRTSLERTLRGLAQAAEQEMAILAERQRLRWSFRTVRGRAGEAVAREAGQSDLVVLPDTGGRLTRPRGLALPGLRSRPSSLLLLRSETPPLPPVLVGWDGTAAGERALSLARALAGAAESALVIVLLAATREHAEELAARFEERFGGTEALSRARPVDRLDRAMVMATTQGCGLVVWPDPDGHLELATATPHCSLLLVR